MRRWIGILIAVAVASAVALVAAVPLAMSATSRPLLTFDSMVGVSGAFVGSSNPLRGINGGGFPWILSKGTVKLTADGELQVEVEGLVIDPNNATAQAKGIAGVNPLPYFFATLSCLDANGATVNVHTTTFPATSSGDAEIDQVIALPSTCFAPLVFVQGTATAGSSTGPWFAVSGF